MSKLTRSEKNRIILDEAKGIQHPDYYVVPTKSGGVQVRKRKVSLVSEPVATPTVETPAPIAQAPQPSGITPAPELKVDYESITNKQLLEKMLLILENNVMCKNQMLNDPERERETADNRQFVDGVKDQSEKPIVTKERVAIKEPEQQTSPETQPRRLPQRIRRGRVL